MYETVYVPVTLQQLMEAGFDVFGAGLDTTGSAQPLRIALVYEPEEDGTPAVGFYLQTQAGGEWRDIEPWCHNLDEACSNNLALDRAAQRGRPEITKLFKAWGTLME